MSTRQPAARPTCSRFRCPDSRRRTSPSARRYLLREQPERPASRVFQFPVEIDTDEIRATLQAGILSIHVPKAAASRPRVIKVNQAA